MRRHLPKFLAAALAVVTSFGALSSSAMPDPKRARARILRYALLQSEKPAFDWAKEQRDCAGFVRYVYRKAVGEKDPLWVDRSGKPTFFASAQELVQNNFVSVTTPFDEESYRTGDVLVFYSPEKKPDDRWHLMMVLKTPSRSARDVLVIYHNGETGEKGRVRKLWLDELRAPAMSEWNPRSSNPRFMGLYRWKGLS